jgi:uncharacterized membrane protein
VLVLELEEQRRLFLTGICGSVLDEIWTTIGKIIFKYLTGRTMTKTKIDKNNRRKMSTAAILLSVVAYFIFCINKYGQC